MPSRLRTVRDQATAAIAALAAVTARGIVPAAVWTPPERERATMAAAEIIVAPFTRETVLVSRGLASETIVIHAAIFDPLELATEAASGDNDQILAEAIIDGLLTTKLAAGYTCISAGQPTIRDVDHWRSKRLFSSFVELTFQA